MHHRLRATWVLAPIVAGLLAAADARAGTLLRLKVTPGQTHRFLVTQETSTHVDLGMLGERETEGLTRIEFTQTVREQLAEDRLLLETTYERVTMETTGGGQTVRFDSSESLDDQEVSPMTEMLRTFVGKRFDVEVSRRGKVLQVHGLGEVFENSFTEFPDTEAADQLKQLLRQSLGEDALLNMLQQVSAVFPEESVRTGSEWINHVTVRNPAVGNLDVRTRYRVEGTEKREGRSCVRLAVGSDTKLGEEIPLVDQLNRMFADGGVELSVGWELNEASGDGTMWIDRKTGLVAEMSTTGNVDMDISVDMEEGPMTVRMSMTQQMRLQLVE